MPAYIDPIQKDPALRRALIGWAGGPGLAIMDGLQEIAYLISDPKKRISYRALRNNAEFHKQAKAISYQLSLDLAGGHEGREAGKTDPKTTLSQAIDELGRSMSSETSPQPHNPIKPTR